MLNTHHTYPTTSASTHANLPLLSSEPSAVVRGVPREGGGVVVSAVPYLVIRLEAVSTAEHFVSKTRTRQIRS